MTLTVWTSGCLDRPKGTSGSGQPVAAQIVSAATSVSAGARPAAVAAFALGLDRCVVGSWRSTDVTINNKLVRLSGGANVEVTINPGGDCIIDFAPMSIVNGAAGGSAFDFRYVGKGTGTFKTSSAGVISILNKNISSLRVNANVRMPNGGATPLLTNTPAEHLIPRGAAANGSSTQGIDPFPVLSADSYTCSPTQLVLTSSTTLTQWTFNRIGRIPK